MSDRVTLWASMPMVRRLTDLAGISWNGTSSTGVWFDFAHASTSLGTRGVSKGHPERKSRGRPCWVTPGRHPPACRRVHGSRGRGTRATARRAQLDNARWLVYHLIHLPDTRV